MKRKTICLVAAMTTLATLAVACSRTKAKEEERKRVPPPPPTPTEAKRLSQLAESNNTFALKLFKELAKSEGNVCCSPSSVATALSMAYMGAEGDTAREIEQMLSLSLPQTEIPAAFKQFNQQLNAREGILLETANALCLTGSDVRQDYKALLKQSFEAEIFRGNLDTINSWAKKKTYGKIPTILDHLSPNSVCVLLNAVYFNGKWKTPFKKYATRDDAFFVTKGRSVRVPMMCTSSYFSYLNMANCAAISIPYECDSVTMVILLPSKTDGLPKLLQDITSSALSSLCTRLQAGRRVKIRLHLPRFKFESKLPLEDACKRLGMSDAFNRKANFQRIYGQPGDIWISQVKHRAMIEVNEKGTEAAAATALGLKTKGESKTAPPLFKADHPFLFLIRDNATGSILFMGRVSDPSK